MRRGGSGRSSSWANLRWGQRMCFGVRWGGQPRRPAVCVSTSSISSAFCCRLGCSSRTLWPLALAQQFFDPILAGQLCCTSTSGGDFNGSSPAVVALQHPLQDLAGGGRCWASAV